jgi:hypothetical protein
LVGDSGRFVCIARVVSDERGGSKDEGMTTPSFDPALPEAAEVTEQQGRAELVSPGQLQGRAVGNREAEIQGFSAQAAENGYSYDEYQLISSLQSLAQAPPAGYGQHEYYDDGMGEYEEDHTIASTSRHRLGGRGKRAKGTSYYGYPTESRKSLYRGVSWFKRGRKWRVAIKVAELGKNDVHVGFFVHEEDAARAYDVTLLGLYGRALGTRHKTNFDSEEYTFDKIPALMNQNREGIREELESWFGPARFTVIRDGGYIYQHQKPGYKQLESMRSAPYAKSYEPGGAFGNKWTHADEDGAMVGGDEGSEGGESGEDVESGGSGEDVEGGDVVKEE